jgi:hypothetical protein
MVLLRLLTLVFRHAIKLLLTAPLLLPITATPRRSVAIAAAVTGMIGLFLVGLVGHRRLL